MRSETMYRARTHGIEVTVEPFYLEERSNPDSSRYVWGYKINIANRSALRVQLMERYWRITDANGQVEEVSGDGVVGEQPVLEPGESFEYSSGCPLETPSGMMIGRYRMERSDGSSVDVDIPAFSLDLPGVARTIN